MSKLEESRRRATNSHAQGKLAEAVEQYLKILEEYPTDFETLFLVGLLEGQRTNFDDAVAYLSRALQVDPNNANAKIYLGRAHLGAGRVDMALASFEEVLTHDPSNAEALLARGSLLLETGRTSESMDCLERLLQAHPKNATAWLLRGHALWELKDLAAALSSYQKARETNPTIADLHLREGEALLALDRNQQAREAFDRAVQIDANLVDAHLGRASALIKQRNIIGALVSADRARQIQPSSARAYCILGCGQFELGHTELALEFLETALRLEPAYAEARFAQGEVLQHLGKCDEAATAFAAVIDSKPSMHMAFGHLLHNRMRTCNWREFGPLCSNITNMIDNVLLAITPFALQSFCDDPATLAKCARNTTAHFHPRGTRSLWRTRFRNGGKFRIGFLGSEFGESLLAAALEAVWASHDTSTFEFVVIDSGFDDGSSRRKHLQQLFTQWVMVTDLSDVDSALRIASLQVDLLIDLNGFQDKGRPGILALRPARVQARFMGFPGTLGSDYVDYLITDSYSVPPGISKHFNEQLIALSECAKPVVQVPSEGTPKVSRKDLGLPDDGLLLATHADGFKITPSIFDTWMRILARVPKAYLWFINSTPAIEKNLHAAAQTSGIGSDRIYFSKSATTVEEIASRLSVVDLLLDTSPFSDADSAGIAIVMAVPVITLVGNSMSSHATGSLLNSLELNELIADTLSSYEEQAVLALSTPEHLSSIRQKMISNPLRSAVLDPARHARHLEKAFRYMIERAENGLPAAAVQIEATVLN